MRSEGINLIPHVQFLLINYIYNSVTCIMYRFINLTKGSNFIYYYKIRLSDTNEM